MGVAKLCWVPTAGLNEQSDLKCTERGHSHRGSGYHRVYDEKTKHALEASVLMGRLSTVGWNGEEMLPEPARFAVLGWWNSS